MSTPPTLSHKLRAVYQALVEGVDYTLSLDGSAIAAWTPRQESLREPTLAVVASAYAARLRREEKTAKVAAARAALEAFWNGLTPSQQKPLLAQKSTIKATLDSDTPATVLLIQDMAESITGLSDAQSALKATALAACAELVA